MTLAPIHTLQLTFIGTHNFKDTESKTTLFRLPKIFNRNIFPYVFSKAICLTSNETWQLIQHISINISKVILVGT